jgi:hypothetical protein
MAINIATWKIISVTNAIQELAWLLGDDVDYNDVLTSLQVSALISPKLASDVDEINFYVHHKYGDDDYIEEEHLGCQNFPVCDTEGCGGGK